MIGAEKRRANKNESSGQEDKDRTDSVAVEVNSEYRVAKCQ